MPEKVKDIRLRPSEEVASLVDQMRSAGGFMGRHLAEVARIYTDMLDDPRCTKFLSFPAAVVATGTRGVIADMIREGMVDVVVTASGTLDHDLARSWGDYYHGSFDMDDVKVKKEGFHRLGNVLVPLEAYGPAIEGRLQPWLEQRYQGGARSMTTEELSAGLGELGDDRSILRCAKEKGVPVFVPGPMDGAVGSQVWLFANRRSDFRIDVIGDEKRLADITFDSKKSGALVVGGGISKHHLIWWSQFKGGLDYACYITTATEYDGSLSGAQVKEAVSWGKVRPRAKKATLIADATAVLPLVATYALTRRKPRR
ncbi:MAG: deoxyhypusine synthase [Nitrososphaerota archaeon]|nr:deoxyhypusine synthase [Nitrososphaerota archaeon]MDG6966850.1 deoxyhypusine synthase [Nitrososphaerota archaeon]MDG6978010.1 deoxyhypusine synthase [Nitrososphaerota archaeon]MDG7020934.1 deoxyhypusine synthase [Nitrososphaerota archaeon]MDG7022280.1 deoxyhypusine synthase [Nitrososphaerota archaeon]